MIRLSTTLLLTLIVFTYTTINMEAQKNNPFSREALEKKIEWCDDSIKMATETIEFFEKEIEYTNEDYVPAIDLTSIVHNLGVASPEQLKTLYKPIVEAYKNAIIELTNLRDNSKKILNRK